MWQTFDLQNPAIEYILLALLTHSQLALLNGRIGNRIHQVSQGDPWLHLTLETHQYRLRHIERHCPHCSSECHESRACGERYPYREPCVRIATGTYRIRQDHTV